MDVEHKSKTSFDLIEGLNLKLKNKTEQYESCKQKLDVAEDQLAANRIKYHERNREFDTLKHDNE